MLLAKDLDRTEPGSLALGVEPSLRDLAVLRIEIETEAAHRRRAVFSPLSRRRGGGGGERLGCNRVALRAQLSRRQRGIQDAERGRALGGGG